MADNKYNKVTVKIDGVEVERSKVRFVPVENNLGGFCTSDGKKYHRDLQTGQIRRIK